MSRSVFLPKYRRVNFRVRGFHLVCRSLPFVADRCLFSWCFQLTETGLGHPVADRDLSPGWAGFIGTVAAFFLPWSPSSWREQHTCLVDAGWVAIPAMRMVTWWWCKNGIEFKKHLNVHYPLVMTNLLFNGNTPFSDGHFEVRYVSHYQRFRSTNLEETQLEQALPATVSGWARSFHCLFCWTSAEGRDGGSKLHRPWWFTPSVPPRNW